MEQLMIVNVKVRNLPFVSSSCSCHMLELFAASDLEQCLSAFWVKTKGDAQTNLVEPLGASS
jgi:hypothetical protein